MARHTINARFDADELHALTSFAKGVGQSIAGALRLLVRTHLDVKHAPRSTAKHRAVRR